MRRRARMCTSRSRFRSSRAKAGGWSRSPAGTNGWCRLARSSVPVRITRRHASSIPGRSDRQGRGGADVELPECHAGFGSPADGPPPPEIDYDMWLGPAPKRPYNANRSLYHFRWFWDYSGGQMTNLGQHSLDIVHWFLDATCTVAVTSAGGRFALQDNGETPDTQDADLRISGVDCYLVATGVQQGCRAGLRPGVLRYQGQFEDFAQGFLGDEPTRSSSPVTCCPDLERLTPLAGR